MANILSGRNLAQIPNSPTTQVDNAIDVDAVLRTHEYGSFNLSARFADQILRDDRISGVLSTRIGGLLSSPLEVKPATAKRKAAKVAEILGGVDETPGIWDELFPDDVLGEMLRWGLLCNIAVADILWQGTADDVRPRLRVWHPQFIFWSWATFSYWINTAEGQVELPRIDENPRSDGRWVVWCPRGYYYGWMHALVRQLGKLAIARAWTFRDWARYNEVHGGPIKVGIVPPGASEQVKAEFHNALATSGSDGTMTVPQGNAPGDDKFDVKLVEATGRTWETFPEAKKALDADIAIVVLGQDLPSQSHGGGMGDGKAESFELVRADKRSEDARLTKCLRQQVLTHWAAANFDDPELAPRAEYQIRPPDDENEEALALKALGDAIQSLQLAGVPVDIRTIADRAGVPMLSEEEAAAQEAEEDAKAAEIAAQQQAGGAAGAPAADDEAPPSKAAARAVLRSAAGKRRASRYIGQLEQAAKRQAARAMRPGLEAVRAAVEHATSYDDLRARLVTAFGHMDAHGMAAVLRKAHVMAQLAGRGEALAEV